MAKKRKGIDAVTEMDKIFGEMFLESFKNYLEEVIKEGEEKKKNIGKPTKEIPQHKMI